MVGHYLDLLLRAGITVTLLSDRVLLLKPDSLITEELDRMVREYKDVIIAELLDVSGPRVIHCKECWRRVQLTPADIQADRETIRWYSFACRCGRFEGYMTERDYQRWRTRKRRFFHE